MLTTYLGSFLVTVNQVLDVSRVGFVPEISSGRVLAPKHTLADKIKIFDEFFTTPDRKSPDEYLLDKLVLISHHCNG